MSDPNSDPETKSESSDPETKSESEFESDDEEETNVGRNKNMFPRNEIPRRHFFRNLPMLETGYYAYNHIASMLPVSGWERNSHPLPQDFFTNVKAAARFVLLTDSSETFNRLFSRRCDIRHNLLLVKGNNGEATCYFLRLLKRELGFPIFALVDCDPSSLKLLDLYETWIPEGMPEHLAQVELDIKWLGIRNLGWGKICEEDDDGPSPCIQVPGSSVTVPVNLGCIAEMDDDDLTVANSLLDSRFVNKSEERVAEVKRMIDQKWIMEVIAIPEHFAVLDYLPSILELGKSGSII